MEPEASALREGAPFKVPTWLRSLLLSPVPLFLGVSIFLFAIHEPWRDETQPWLVARDAGNFFSMLDSETHPPLWYLIAFPFAKLGFPYETLRVVHLVIATAALSVFVLHAPFSRVEKWLFSFGYFVLYEYSAITRNYAPMLLCLFLVAATWRRRFERPILHGALLVLLANTVGHGAVFAALLGAAYGIEWLVRADVRRVRALAAPVLAVAGVLVAYLSVKERPDIAEWRTGWSSFWADWLAQATAKAPIHAFVPIPKFEGYVWGETWLEGQLEGDEITRVAALILAVTALVLLWRPRALALYLAGGAALLTLYYLKSGISAQTRHHGLLFVWWIFCIWIARLDAPDGRLFPWVWPTRAAGGVVAAVLLLHVAASAPAIQADTRDTFSGGQDGAAWLEEHGYADDATFIGVYPNWIAAPVLAHMPLSKTCFWFLQTMECGSYTRWTHEEARTFRLPLDVLLQGFKLEAAKHPDQTPILVTSFAMDGFDPEFQRLAGWDSLSPGDAVFIWSYQPAAT